MSILTASHTRDISKGFDPKATSTRVMSVGSIDAEKRTLELSFSSEAEVERWWGVEILDHSAGACDLKRLNTSGPLLFNHDLDEVIGVIEKAWIGSDGKGRALVRFSKSEDAETVWQDVQDGILRNVSVGYRINEYVEEKQDEKYIIRATSWEPYEISIVSAPADTSVGIGRNLTPHQRNEPKQIMNRSEMIAWLAARGITVAETVTDDELKRQITEFKPAAPAPAPTPAPTPEPAQRTITVTQDNSAATIAERSRINQIRSLGAECKLEASVIDKAVNDGVPVGDFRGVALEAMQKRSQTINQMNAPIGLSQTEAGKFSLQRLLRSACDPNDTYLREAAAFEYDVCSAARRSNPSAQGQVIIPHEILAMDVTGRRDIVSIKSGSGYTGTAGELVETSLLSGSYYGVLRNKATILQSCSLMTGLQGNYDIPYMSAGAANASWLGAEDDEAEDRDIDFLSKQLTPKTVACKGSITRQTIMQTSLDSEAILRKELAECMAQPIDYAGYYGTGADGQPLGIRYTSGINFAWFTADAPTFAELVAMETAVASANIDPATSRYRFNAALRGGFKTAKKYPAGSDSVMILNDNGEINGYGHDMTNQIKNNQVFFGDFKELWCGMWGGLDLIVDPFTFASRGRVRLVNFQTIDFRVRRENAFTFGSKLANS